MSFELPRKIEEWYDHFGEDVEFVRCGRAEAFSVVGPSQTEANPIYVYATKPHCILAAKREYPEFDAVGLISRTGLPSTDDVGWIRNLLAQRELVFLGDMDPVDLLVFAWLRAYLDHSQVTHLGVSDSYLNQLGIELPESFIISCAPSEKQSLSFLESVLPDYRALVGPDCATLLDDGRKIELEAVVTRLGPAAPQFTWPA
jgi:hypothetical protein